MIECARPGGCASRLSRAAGSCPLIVAGMSPQAAAAACGASSRDRLSALASLPGGRLAGARAIVLRPRVDSRAGLPPEAEREILRWRGELGAGPGGDRRHRRASRLDRPQGAATGGLLAASARPPRPARPLRARATRRAPARRHQEARPLLRDRQAHPPRRDQPLPQAGWQHLHVAIDDHSRLAYCEILRSRAQGRLRRLPAPRRAPGIASRGSSSSACSPTTRRPTTRTSGATPAPSSGSSAATRAPTRRGRTARRKR